MQLNIKSFIRCVFDRILLDRILDRLEYYYYYYYLHRMFPYVIPVLVRYADSRSRNIRKLAK